MGLNINMLTGVVAAVSRYLLVSKRAVLGRVFSDRGLILLVISAWALGLASFGPLWPVYVFVPHVCTCSIHRTRGRPYTNILLFFYFLFSLLCMGLFYLLIYRLVLFASQALLCYRALPQSHQQLSPNIVTTPPSPTNKASSSHTIASGDDQDMKHVKHICLTVFLCYVLCFVPFMLHNIAYTHNRAPLVLQMFCANLIWLNSCINPISYAVMNRQFRKAYHELLNRAAAPLTW
ncbi:G-protein coupled receptor 84-like [Symphorus nematophorus]